MDAVDTLQIRDAECGFDGTPDLYGLGVRIALYIQFFTAFLVALGLHGEHQLRFYRIASLSFLVSLYLVVIIKSADNTLRGVEAQLMSWLFIVQFFTVLTTMSKSKLSKMMKKGLGLFLFMWIFFTALGTYMVWFWYVGLDRMPRSDCPDEYGFFWTKVRRATLAVFHHCSLLSGQHLPLVQDHKQGHLHGISSHIFFL